MEEEELLTTKELMQHYKLSRRTITRYVSEGMPVYLDHPRRFKVSQTDEWIKNKERRK